MLTLRAGLEEGDLALDAALDTCVVGGLEVEKLAFLYAAPISAVKRGGGLEEQRAGAGVIA